VYETEESVNNMPRMLGCVLEKNAMITWVVAWEVRNRLFLFNSVTQRSGGSCFGLRTRIGKQLSIEAELIGRCHMQDVNATYHNMMVWRPVILTEVS
jgi:hypothetical protein